MPQRFSTQLLFQIRHVTQIIPSSTLDSFIQVIEQVDSLTPSLINQSLQRIPKASWRREVSALLKHFQQHSYNVSGATIAAVISTAMYCQRQTEDEFSLELVWTGPLPEGSQFRRTDQALLQLIRETKQTLLIISFAVYKIPEIVEALQQAINRGVRIKFVFELPEVSQSKISYGGLAVLGPKILGQSQLFIWAREKRLMDAEGKTGSLHAKVAVADGQHLFVSSANLTGYALAINIEMGVIIHNQSLAEQVIEHVEKLIHDSILEEYT